MTLFLRQRNEALDEDQKTLREQLGLYKKQVEIWEKAAEEPQGPGLEMLDSADYFKYKILISNFSEAINQISQNFGKQDFAGIGGLQKAYEALARFARNVIEGPYLTADKERVFNMLKPAIGALQKIQALAAEDAFSATEKVVVGNILRNIAEKIFEPLGFLDVPSEGEREAEIEKRKQRSKRGEPIDTVDERFIELKGKIDNAVKATPAGELKENLKREQFRLKNNSSKGKISQKMFDEISNAYDRLVPPPPPPPDEEEDEREFLPDNDAGYVRLMDLAAQIQKDERLSRDLRKKGKNLEKFMKLETKNGRILLENFINADKFLNDLIEEINAEVARGPPPPRDTRARSRTPAGEER